MTINDLLEKKLFDMYSQIFSKVQQVQKSESQIEVKKNQMKTLREEYYSQALKYNQIAIAYAKEFINKYQLPDHPIEAKVGSPTPYGNQPKSYLWSGISIEKEKSYSFQYSWVFKQEELEVTFCFGSGGSSSGKTDKDKRSARENGMRELEARFIQTISIPTNRAVINQLINHEGFILTSEWLNSDNQEIQNIDQFINRIKEKTGAKSGITRYFTKEELLTEGFDLEEKIQRYFNIIRPIWDQLHDSSPLIDITNNVEKPIITVKEQLQIIKTYIGQKGFVYPLNLIENLYLSLRTKPFVILAGISGTGKTRLVRLIAEAMGATKENKQFTLVPVRPDWSDPTELIGFENLNGDFQPRELTKIIIEASKSENQSKPYFFCLDEMNLARVEHYFSDILSVLESQKWEGDKIVTDTLVNVDDTKYSIPENLFIIGTVNMDETTYPFSKKVLDRANTIEFNYIELMNFPDIQPTTTEQSTALPASFLRSDFLVLQDAFASHADLIKRTTEKLVTINKILEETHSHIGFRVRDAVCFFIIYNERFGNLMSEDEAFDAQMMQKILPRIQGSSPSIKRVIIQLLRFCEDKNPGSIDPNLDNDASELYKTYGKSNTPVGVRYTYSAKKLAYMLRRMDEDGFTSFWLS